MEINGAGIKIEIRNKYLVRKNVPNPMAIAQTLILLISSELYLSASKSPLTASPSITKISLKLATPKISLTLVIAITAAIPTVKPTTMELGTNLAYLPMPSKPIIINTTPAIIDTSTKKPCACCGVPPLASPYFATSPAIRGINAAVGP